MENTHKAPGTDTPATRANRISVLHSRAAHKFRDALFAFRLMESRIEGMDRTTADYKQASALMCRAINSMDHWNKRASQLARAEVRTILGIPHH